VNVNLIENKNCEDNSNDKCKLDIEKDNQKESNTKEYNIVSRTLN